MGETPEDTAGNASLPEKELEAAPHESLTIGGYMTVAELSKGTHGITYKATREDSTQLVALKVVKSTPASEKTIARAKGAQTGLGAIRHQNIATFIELGFDEALASHFIATEFIEGEALDAVLKSRSALQEPDVMAIAIQAANALDCIYGRKLTHGDIRPSNVIITRGGIVKLVNLGLSLPSLGTDEASLKDAHYVSPEATTTGQIDIRSDVYSLGATLYHALTGKPPFADADPARVLASHKDRQIPNPCDVVPGVSSGLSRIITNMMATIPEERYRTPTELTLDLNIVKEGQDPVIAANAPSRSTVAPSNTVQLAGPSAKSSRKPTGRPSTQPRLRKVTAGRTGKTAQIVKVQSPQRSNTWKIVAAAGGGLAVLVLGLVLMLSGDEQQTKVPPPIDDPTVTADIGAPGMPSAPSEVPSAPKANTAQKAKQLLVEARKHASEKPDDYSGLLARYESCLESGRGTPLQEEIEREIKSLRAFQKDAARMVLNKTVEEAESLAEAGNFDLALAEFDQIPAEIVAVIPDDVKNAEDAIRRAGDENLNAVLAKAAMLLGETKSSEARFALMGLDAIHYAEGRTALKAKENEILQRIRSVEESTRSEADEKARQALPGLLAQFDELVDQHQYWDARKLMIDAAKRPELAPLAQLLGAAGFVAGELGNRVDTMMETVTARVGEEIALETVKGKKKGVVKEALWAGVALGIKVIVNGKVMGETKRVIPWSDLKWDEQALLTKAWEPNHANSSRVALAILAIERDDLDGAEKLLGEAGKFPMVDHVRTRIDSKRLGSGEAEAMAEWRALEPKVNRGRISSAEAKALSDLLDEFAEKHADTQFLKSIENELSEVRTRVDSADTTSKPKGKIPPDALSFRQNRYKAYPGPLTYADARAACEALGGHLVTVTSPEEMAFVFDKVIPKPIGATLIGLSDIGHEGSWVWDTGEPFVFGHWAINEPNNSRNAEHCTITGWGGKSPWNDVPEDLGYRYVCEWDSTRSLAAAKKLPDTGLLGTYFETDNFTSPVMRRLDSQFCFLWGPQSPDKEHMPGDKFSVRWEGFLIPPESSDYTFEMWVDDYAKLWIGDELVVDRGARPGTHLSKPTRLVGGKAVPIKIEHYDVGGGALYRLRWAWEGTKMTLLETQYLRPPKDYLKHKSPPLVTPKPAASKKK